MSFSDDDRRQFDQLTGWSVDGYGNLPHVTREHWEAAYAMATEGVDERDARIEALTNELESMRQAMRQVFEIASEHAGDD